MLSKWKVKAIVQKGISFFPNRERINYLFQLYVTKGVLLTDEHFELKLGHARDHLQYFDKYRPEGIGGKRMLELGTGWYPIVPIAMYLSGIGQVISLDIQSWMNKKSQLRCIELYIQWHQAGKLQQYLPNIIEERWKQIEEIHARPDAFTSTSINQAIQLSPLLLDARDTGMEAESLDFICSNNTFEHIYEEVLRDILREFVRLLRPGGVMSHFVDLSDHFAHFDQSINIYNFLRYSETQWRRIDNRIQPQNRMRWRDYRELYAELGIEITEEETRPGDQESLGSVPLAEMYRDYSSEELAISHGYLVTRG